MLHTKYDTKFFIENILIYDASIYNFLYSIISDHEVAKDLKQNTMEKAWQKLDQLNKPNKAKSWIFSIAYREANQYFRVNGRSNEYIHTDEDFSIDDFGDKKDEALEILIKEYEMGILNDALELLNSKYKRLLKMRYMEELTIKEIADTLNMNYSTARVYLVRAIKMTKNLYDELETC